MALDPRMILQGAQTALAADQSNPLGAIQQGQQLQQNILRQQAQEQAIRQAEAEAPLRQTLMQQQVEQGRLGLEETMAQMDQATRDRSALGVVNLASQAAVLPLEQQVSFVRENARQLDIPDVADLSDFIVNASDEEIIEAIPQLVELGRSQGVIGKTPSKTASEKDFETFQRLMAEDPKKGVMFGRQSGFIRPTEEEKADIKVDEAARKEVAKATVSRKQGFIDSGVDAADSTANIRRSLQLLDDVETGGFDSVALRVKQFFGVEGADEGELSANLGRSVLAQLKPIFGAAFTAAEGERLERIEAGFGRSPESNKRLLKNALTIAERAARRGLAAAEDAKDNFTANEIRSALEFELTPKGEQAQQQAQPVRLRFNPSTEQLEPM